MGTWRPRVWYKGSYRAYAILYVLYGIEYVVSSMVGLGLIEGTWMLGRLNQQA